MSEAKNIFAILDELKGNAKQIDNEGLESVEKLITEAKRIFVGGAGRSGFAARGFSNRLMHLGYTVYFVGEPTTPSIPKKAKDQGAKVATLTMFPENKIGSMADAIIKIPGVTEKCVDQNKGGSVQASGSSFEELSWITYDAMVMDLMRITNQNSEDLFKRHANME